MPHVTKTGTELRYFLDLYRRILKRLRIHFTLIYTKTMQCNHDIYDIRLL